MGPPLAHHQVEESLPLQTEKKINFYIGIYKSQMIEVNVVMKRNGTDSFNTIKMKWLNNMQSGFKSNV